MSFIRTYSRLLAIRIKNYLESKSIERRFQWDVPTQIGIEMFENLFEHIDYIDTLSHSPVKQFTIQLPNLDRKERKVNQIYITIV